MFSSLTDCFTLSNGVKIPCVGFGTYKTPDGATCVESVKTAIEAGYRHIDTAEFYFNEESVGRAVAESGVPRGELFLTTKVWNTPPGLRRHSRRLRRVHAQAGAGRTRPLPRPLAHSKGFQGEYPTRFIDTWRALELSTVTDLSAQSVFVIA